MDVIATIQSVIPKGKHGAYAVATANEVEGSITFSLARPVWTENDQPEPGTRVILSDLRLKSAGWRALSARYVRPADKQPATSIEQKGKTDEPERQ